MKKYLLLTGLCFVFACSTNAIAECNGCPTAQYITARCGQEVQGCPIKKLSECDKKQEIYCQKSVKQFKNYIQKVQRERATIYNALNLTEAQIIEREELVKENTPIYEEKFQELTKESYTLKALKGAKAGDKEINAQKKVVKNIKNDIEELINKEDKAFKKCLTREQRSKYAMIKKLERKEYKKLTHQKDYYKSNPKMVPFGNPKTCPNK